MAVFLLQALQHFLFAGEPFPWTWLAFAFLSWMGGLNLKQEIFLWESQFALGGIPFCLLLKPCPDLVGLLLTETPGHMPSLFFFTELLQDPLSYNWPWNKETEALLLESSLFPLGPVALH